MNPQVEYILVAPSTRDCIMWARAQGIRQDSVLLVKPDGSNSERLRGIRLPGLKVRVLSADSNCQPYEDLVRLIERVIGTSFSDGLAR